MTLKDQATDTKAENLITSNQRRSKVKTQPTGWGDISVVRPVLEALLDTWQAEAQRFKSQTLEI